MAFYPTNIGVNLSGGLSGGPAGIGAQRASSFDMVAHQAKLRAKRTARKELTGLKQERKAAQVEEQKRYESGLADIAKVTELFGPEYTAGMEHMAMTGARQSMIGRGLGGTTRPMAVSAGMKAQFESLRRGKMAEALTRMAEYKRTPQQIYPGGGEVSAARGAYTNVLQQPLIQAPQQPMTIASGGGPAGGPTYMASAAARAQRFMSDSFGGGSDVPIIDFNLPSSRTPNQSSLTPQQKQYTWT
jgi:hypothetical protein